MLNSITSRIRNAWYALSQVPPGYFGTSEYRVGSPRRNPICSAEHALTLSPFWAALRLYQNSISVLPLVTYETDAQGGRTRYQDKSIYGLLHDRPNPAMSRAAFIEFLVREYFCSGECFALIQWAGNHRLLGLYPVCSSSVQEVVVDSGWNKSYKVNGIEGWVTDAEMLHVCHFSRDGIRGTPFIRYASESLGLHKQVLDSATAYYANAAKPSGFIKYPGKLTKQASDNLREGFVNEFSGAENTGKIPVICDGGDYQSISGTTAEDAQIIEALGASVEDIGRWFDNLSPLILGDLSRGTYSNSLADKLAFHQKNLLPLLEKFQLEINHKLFGSGSDIYSEFLTDNILRADPLTQSQIWHAGITDGYLLKSEVRAWLNLPPIDGIDDVAEPVQPVQAQPAQETYGQDANTVDQVSTNN